MKVLLMLIFQAALSMIKVATIIAAFKAVDGFRLL